MERSMQLVRNNLRKHVQSYDSVRLDKLAEAKRNSASLYVAEQLLLLPKKNTLKRFYKKHESKHKLPSFSNYYKNYLVFFCKPTFRDFNLNKISQKHGDAKAELFYKVNYETKSKQQFNFSTMITSKIKKKIENSVSITISRGKSSVDANLMSVAESVSPFSKREQSFFSCSLFVKKKNPIKDKFSKMKPAEIKKKFKKEIQNVFRKPKKKGEVRKNEIKEIVKMTVDQCFEKLKGKKPKKVIKQVSTFNNLTIKITSSRNNRKGINTLLNGENTYSRNKAKGSCMFSNYLTTHKQLSKKPNTIFKTSHRSKSRQKPLEELKKSISKKIKKLKESLKKRKY